MSNSSFTRPAGQTCFMRYATKGERRVARKLVQRLLDLGYTVSVNDGVEWTVRHATRLQTVLDALCSTGEDVVRARDKAGEPVADFSLIWGNAEDGEELVADHSDNEAANGIMRWVTGEDEE